MGVFISDLLFAVFIFFWIDVGWPYQEKSVITQGVITGFYICGLCCSVLFFLHDYFYQVKKQLSEETVFFKSDEERIRYEIDLELLMAFRNGETRDVESEEVVDTTRGELESDCDSDGESEGDSEKEELVGDGVEKDVGDKVE